MSIACSVPRLVSFKEYLPARSPFAALFLAAALLLTGPPARAGHWDLQAACTQQPTPDPSFSSHVGGGNFQIGPCHSQANTGGGQTANASMTATITLTATWVPDGAPASDPPPPKLMLEESATTSWSGSSSAGQAPTGSSGNPVGGAETPMSPPPSASNAGGTRTGHAFTAMSVSGGTATLTRVFTGSASAASSPQRGCSATAGLDGYSAHIHAHPYNFKEASYSDDGQGQMFFTYNWKSTSGDLNSINGLVYEHVDYSGNPCPPGQHITDSTTGKPGYEPPSPPFGGWYLPLIADHYLDPTNTAVSAAANAGKLDDSQFKLKIFNIGTDNKYQPASFSGVQEYRFHCGTPGCPDNSTPTKIDGPDAGAYTILRDFSLRDGTKTPRDWLYKVTKGSHSAQVIVNYEPPF